MEKGWKVLLKKGVTLLKFMMFKNFATQEEAEQRASICLKCPLNKKPADKPFYERWAQKASVDAVGDRRTSLHEKLYECQGCGCNLRAKVWIGDNIELYQDEVDLMRANKPDCWQVNSKKLVILRDEGPPP